MGYYSEGPDNRADEAHDRLVQEIAQGLGASLVQYEEYFFQETIKKLHLDGQDSSRKIEKTIDDVLVNEPNQYIQTVGAYKQCAYAVGTQSDARSLYIDELKKKFCEGLSNEDINRLVSDFFNFLEQNEDLGNKNISDIDAFIETIKNTVKDEYKIKKMKAFLEKTIYGVNKTENQKTEEKIILTNTLIEFPSKNDLTDEEWKELQEIKNELKNIIGGLFYEDVIVDFLDQMKQIDGFSWDKVNHVVRGLIKKHNISGEKETLESDLPDYLLRLLPIMAKKK